MHPRKAARRLSPCSGDGPESGADPRGQAAPGETTGEACTRGQQCILQRKTWQTASASDRMGFTVLK